MYTKRTYMFKIEIKDESKARSKIIFFTHNYITFTTPPVIFKKKFPPSTPLLLFAKKFYLPP